VSDSASTDNDDRTDRLCHDLRQYVSAGALVARMPDDTALPRDVRRRFTTIAQVFDLMTEILDGHLGGPRVIRPTVDLVDLVDEAIAVLGASQAVSVVTEVTGAAPTSADPVPLRRAIGNVLDNALRAAGSSGTVQVRVGPEGPLSCIEVTDDGSGYGRITAGQGYGMSVVGSALHACHGRLEISSGPGPGTTVRMLIPSQREAGAGS
jgi:signal transduction histidine kinase